MTRSLLILSVLLSTSAALAQAAPPKTPAAPPPATAKPAPSGPVQTSPAATAPPAVAPAKKVVYAVLPLAAVGVDETSRAQLQSELRSALAKRGLTLQPEAETKAHVAASRLSCLETDTGCLVKLGFIATAQKMVSGRIEPAPGGLRVTLLLVDVEGARQEKRVEDVVATEPLARATDVGRLAGELLGEEAAGGELAIACNKANAQVLVDGVKIGITPLKGPVKGLKRGRYNVEVRLPGHRSYQGVADVENGRVTEVKVELVSVITEEEVVVSEGPLEVTEIHEGPPPTQPTDVSMVPLALLTVGVGGIIIGVVGAVVGAAGLGYSVFLDQSIRTGTGGDPNVQTYSSYVGFGGLIGGAVLIAVGAGATAASFFVE